MRTPRLNGDSVSVVELAHVELACGDGTVRSVRVTVDVHGAHTAYTLTAVVVESDRVFVLGNKLLVENIHHLKERGSLEDVFQLIGLKITLSLRSRLTPNANLDVDVMIHVMQLYFLQSYIIFLNYETIYHNLL